MKSISFFSVLLALIIISASCSSTKKSTTTTASKSYKSTTGLLEEVNKNQALPEWLSTKTNIQYKTEKENQSVTAQIRMRLDSAIWISVTPLLGIEVARILITRDSVKYLNRFNKEYSVQSIASLKRYIPLDGDFFTLQSIILGNHFTYSQNIELKSIIHQNKFYVMSSLNKKELKSTIKKDVLVPIDQQNVWVLPDMYRVGKQLIIDKAASHTINIDYDDFEETDFGWFAKKTELNVSSDSEIKIVLKHSRIQHNKYKTMPFNIPSSYESVN